MKDQLKTKEALIQELVSLRKRILELERSESERKQVEEDLHESKEEYRNILENIEDGYFEVDRAGDFTSFNPSICRILGYPKEEMLGMNYRAYMDAENAKKVFQAFNKVYVTGIPTKGFEWEVIRKDGTRTYIEVSISLIVRPGEKPTRFRGIVRDITERKRAEEALRESEEKYRLSFEYIMDVIYTIDTNLNFLSVSPSMERILGYKPQDFIGRPVSDLGNILMPESFEQAIADISLILKGDTILSTIYRFIAKDGTIKYGEVSGSPIMRDGKIIGIISVARDITDRKRAEGALRALTLRQEAILAAVPEIIMQVDNNKVYTWANSAGIEFFGEDVIGKEADFYFEDEQETYDTVSPLFNGTDDIIYLESWQRRRDGQKRLLAWWCRVLKDESGQVTGALSSARDITERKRAEEALRESEKKYRLIADNMRDAITVMDMNLCFTFVSPSIMRLRGFTVEEVMEQHIEQVMTPESLQISARVFEEEMQREASGTADPDRVRIIQLEEYRKDMSTVWVEVSLSFLRDADGGPIGILSLTRDITERKKAEEQLQETLESLRKAIGATIQVMVSAVESRDPYTAGHQIRSADLARCIATEMGLPHEKIEGLRMAGSIHDIGKLSIPAEILSKPTRLTELEFSLIKEHSKQGYEMLKDVESPWPLAQIVYQHHERMNGSGYPRNLKGDDILIEARILAVADVVEAMASHRPYRPGLGIDAALNEIEKNRGIFYDITVADACLRLFREKGFQLEGT